MQQIIVFFVIFAAVGYACWWGWQKMKNANDPCEGCSGCQLKDLKNCQKQKNHAVMQKSS